MKNQVLAIVNMICTIIYIVIDPYVDDRGRMLFAALMALALGYVVATLSSEKEHKERLQSIDEQMNKLIEQTKVSPQEEEKEEEEKTKWAM